MTIVVWQEAEAKGFLKADQIDPARYMEALQCAGFEGVEMKTERGKFSGGEFQAIYAYKKWIFMS